MSYRCVDWSLLKADERERNGKNAVDPYIHSFSQGCLGKYMNDDDHIIKLKNAEIDKYIIIKI